MSEQRVKVYYGDQIRRFSVTKNTTFSEVMSIFKQILPQAFEREVTFSYQDEDKEWVVFSTETEWSDIIKHCSVEVLYIQVKNSKDSKPIPKVECKKVVIDLLREKRDELKDMKKEIKELVKEKKDDKKKSEIQVNHGVICDGCQTQNFSGSRFKCTVCQDFDFCQKCFCSKIHFAGQHGFLKIEIPQQIKPQQPQIPQQPPQIIPKFSSQQQNQPNQLPIKQPGNDVNKLSEEEQLQLAINLSLQEEEKKKKFQQEIQQQQQIQQPIYPKLDDPFISPKFVDNKEPKVPRFEDLPQNIFQQQQQRPVEVIKPIEVVRPIEVITKPNVVVDVKPNVVVSGNGEEKFAVHQSILANMGFKDVEKNAKLLEKHAGNLQKVVAELLY